MKKLGNEKRPAVVRVRTLQRAHQIMSLCNQHGWKVVAGIEPNKPEDISDVKQLLHSSPQPRQTKKVRVGRNDPCPCGSGKKYKKCCGTL